MEHKEYTMALAVGMNAAACVAREAGYTHAARVITNYRQKWEAKVNPMKPRIMVATDIYPPSGAARYATEGDFGIEAIAAWNTRTGEQA